MLVFNPPQVEHRDRFAPGQRLPAARFVALAIDWPLWLALATDADLPQHALAWHGPAATAWLARLHRVLQLPDATPADTEGLVAELAGAAGTRQERALDAASPWLRQARDALRDDPAFALQPGGLARLARQIGVHPVHLARSFRAALGSTASASNARISSAPRSRVAVTSRGRRNAVRERAFTRLSSIGPFRMVRGSIRNIYASFENASTTSGGACTSSMSTPSPLSGRASFPFGWMNVTS